MRHDPALRPLPLPQLRSSLDSLPLKAFAEYSYQLEVLPFLMTSLPFVSVSAVFLCVCALSVSRVSLHVSVCACVCAVFCVLAAWCVLLKAITRLLLDIIGVAENNGLKLPREFGMLIKWVKATPFY